MDGSVCRDERWMGLRLRDAALLGAYTLYVETGAGAGYALYTLDQRVIDVTELVATDASSVQALLAVFHSHANTQDTLRFILPLNDKLRQAIPKIKGTAAIEPWSMYRILDDKLVMNDPRWTDEMY